VKRSAYGFEEQGGLKNVKVERPLSHAAMMFSRRLVSTKARRILIHLFCLLDAGHYVLHTKMHPPHREVRKRQAIGMPLGGSPKHLIGGDR